MRHWRIYNLFMTTCYMYKITIIIILSYYICIISLICSHTKINS